MTPQELDDIRDTVDCEGFEYAFIHYSDFSEVEDAEFQKLRNNYVKAYEALAEFLGVDV